MKMEDKLSLLRLEVRESNDTIKQKNISIKEQFGIVYSLEGAKTNLNEIFEEKITVRNMMTEVRKMKL